MTSLGGKRFQNQGDKNCKFTVIGLFIEKWFDYPKNQTL